MTKRAVHAQRTGSDPASVRCDCVSGLNHTIPAVHTKGK
jgi:hypothetical protein